MSKPLRIGLIGFGNIGAGVIRTLAAQADLLTTRSPRPLVVKRIADKDLTTPRDAVYSPDQLTADANELFADPDIDVIVELVGGEQPAKTFVEMALRAGKHVVTANKALLALHGPELLALAAEHHVGLLFEAAVGGGIPIIRTLQQGLPANTLTSVMGILNGTCNYILTRMVESGLPFSEALEEAKAKGYAEPDPTYDIEGYDTAHKTAILASLAFGMDIRFHDVHVEGITQIQPIDIRYARELGYAIKLLGIAKFDPSTGAASVRVHPTLVPANSPLGQTSGVYNGIRIDGWPIGTTFYHGRGAGADATSSAVVSDLLALAADTQGFNAARDARLRIPVGQRSIKAMDQLVTHYYIRFTMADRPGAMATIGRALADQGVSIESMIQHRRPDSDVNGATVSIVTHEASEASVQAAIAQVQNHEMSVAKAFILRVEE
jgi:homoserine dehydrogenase